MKKSILVFTIAFLLTGKVSFANDRIPFCKSLQVATDTNEVICTVPTGEQFVLLKLYCTTQNTDWSLTVDNDVLIYGHINDFAWEKETNLTNYHYHHRYVHDFPDFFVVVPAGKTLTFVNPSGMLYLTVIGYFKKVDTGLVSDLSGDGRVDFEDFAILANEWLTTS